MTLLAPLRYFFNPYHDKAGQFTSKHGHAAPTGKQFESFDINRAATGNSVATPKGVANIVGMAKQSDDPSYKGLWVKTDVEGKKRWFKPDDLEHVGNTHSSPTDAHPTSVAQSAQTHSSDVFPTSLASLQPVKKLGGSTGAMLVQDPETGQKYVMKKGSSAGHLESEMHADAMYQALGVDVPKFKRYTDASGKPVKLAEFHEGQTLSDVRGTPTFDQAAKKISQHFAADALLSNWDVAGMGFDNILVAKDGRAFRIDNGGALTYRAQGAPKGAAFGDTVGETATLRDKNKNPYSSRVFQGLTDRDIKSQVEHLDANKDKLLAVTPKHLKEKISARLDDLKKQYGVGSKTSKKFSDTLYVFQV